MPWSPGAPHLYEDAADVQVGAHALLAPLQGHAARAQGEEAVDGGVRPQQARLRQRQRCRVVR